MTNPTIVEFQNQDNDDGGTVIVRASRGTVSVGVSLLTRDIEFEVSPEEALEIANALKNAAENAKRH
jgi:hypothetical protein